MIGYHRSPSFLLIIVVDVEFGVPWKFIVRGSRGHGHCLASKTATKGGEG